MGKPVSSRFKKFTKRKFPSGHDSVYHLHKPVPFKGKRLQKPETGMVSNTTFSIEHEFNRITFSDILLLLAIFHWNDPKSRGQFTFRPNFRKRFAIYGN